MYGIANLINYVCGGGQGIGVSETQARICRPKNEK